MPIAPVPSGMLATVVTYLEMRSPPPAPNQPASSPFRLTRRNGDDLEGYRNLFRRVGTPWLWFSRLVLDDDSLRRILGDPQVEVYAVTNRSGNELGLLELDFRQDGACELAFFGLVPEMTGRGHGKWLMQRATALAWRDGVHRFWLHSCTLDHPAALDFYRAQGFVPYARAVESFADPRLVGLLPADAAPHIPLIGG